MGLSFSDVGNAIARPVHSAVDSLSGNINDIAHSAGGLFSGHGSLLAALATGNPVDIDKTFRRTVDDGPSTVLRDSDGQVRAVVRSVGSAHQSLFDATKDGVDGVIQWVLDTYHNVWDEVKRAWRNVGGKGISDKVANEIDRVVNKLGGEQRIVGWVILAVGVVIIVVVTFFSGGTLSAPAIAGWMALASALMTYGSQAALAPRDEPKALFGRDGTTNNIDNSRITSIGDAGSGQSPSGSLQGFLSGLSNLPPIAVAGIAVAGAVGLWFLLKR